ncbi:FAD-dependent oxidoreductase [Fodinicurvata sp. EGI_FJ10296]|uniref:NAD(P)/FAD-dependent oxidoreductase n=1 Tax=Fodinicurvata sp. EGI_FJ10296 TaxID=3231908 RepID=UPI0034524283
MATADFIVIGAGIAGASIAAALAGEARVALIEQEAHPGYHSTGRSAAMYITNYGPSDVRCLTHASGAFFREPPDDFAGTALVRKRGVLVIAGPGDESILDRMSREASVPVERLTAQQARDLVPIIKPERVAAANYEPDAQDIDVAALHQGFLRRARRAGALVHLNARVQATIRRRDGLWTVPTADGQEVSAPVIVNAAGAWADEVAGAFGAAPIGLVPKRRTAVIIDGPTGYQIADWPMMNDARDTWYARPEAGTKLMVSPIDATPTPPCDAAPEEWDIAVAIDRIQTDLDLTVRRVEHSWAGLRTFSPDGSLVIGPDPEVDGFFWLAGQGGYGIQTSPAAADLARALLYGRDIPEPLRRAGVDPDAVAPARFR